ncbi:MAG: Re/Si-specific NAD(P)(+) transhydrogenase subunit alpha [Alphaproteobacteria bacterium]
MKIVVPKELTAFESRVALTPETVKKIVDLGYKVAVERGSGAGAHLTDEQFSAAGATIAKDQKTLCKDAEVVIRVSPPSSAEIKLLAPGTVILGALRPHDGAARLKAFVTQNVTALAMELLPRISRAQSMDILSSQSNLAGYRAVIEAAFEFGRSFPLMMTAAGTVPPARVLILGAGVAGLQAIATARRMGAVVSAFDVRPAVKEQVESLGAVFVDVPDAMAEGAGGYAKEMDDNAKQRQREKLAEVIALHDIVITTAQIPGKTAPILIDAAMVESMRQGSVIVDLASETGGNCALTEKDKISIHNGVKVIGYTNMPSRIAYDASHVFARNIYHFLKLLMGEGGQPCNWDDEIIQATILNRASL